MSIRDLPRKALDGARTYVPIVIGLVGVWDSLAEWWVDRPAVIRRRERRQRRQAGR